jgi:hypothetical protein
VKLSLILINDVDQRLHYKSQEIHSGRNEKKSSDPFSKLNKAKSNKIIPRNNKTLVYLIFPPGIIFDPIVIILIIPIVIILQIIITNVKILSLCFSLQEKLTN